eukprot:1160105-Pelagomonas_calceolata.AAC.5
MAMPHSRPCEHLPTAWGCPLTLTPAGMDWLWEVASLAAACALHAASHTALVVKTFPMCQKIGQTLCGTSRVARTLSGMRAGLQGGIPHRKRYNHCHCTVVCHPPPAITTDLRH